MKLIEPYAQMRRINLKPLYFVGLMLLVGCAKVEVPQFEAVDLNPTHKSEWLSDRSRIEELRSAIAELPGSWLKADDHPGAGYLLNLRSRSGSLTRFFRGTEWVSFEDEKGAYFVKRVSPENVTRIRSILSKP
jgi:hypothetical protein